MKLNKKTILIYLVGIILFGLLYVSYPKNSEELIGVGLAVVFLIVINAFINKKIRKGVKQYARENISVYNSLAEISRGKQDSRGTTSGNIPGSIATDSKGESGNEESNSNEGHSDIQSKYLEIPKPNEDELPGVPEPDRADSDTVEKHSSSIPDLE